MQVLTVEHQLWVLSIWSRMRPRESPVIAQIAVSGTGVDPGGDHHQDPGEDRILGYCGIAFFIAMIDGLQCP
jgi:hypothetical protein